MFSVTIGVDRAEVTARVATLEEIIALMIPTLMAAGFDKDVQIMPAMADVLEANSDYAVDGVFLPILEDEDEDEDE